MDRSYRALLRVPTLGRVLVSMQIARVAQSMVSIALVLFTLDRYGSAAFAGLVTFASVFPGLLISPLPGALLAPHGRSRLVRPWPPNLGCEPHQRHDDDRAAAHHPPALRPGRDGGRPRLRRVRHLGH